MDEDPAYLRAVSIHLSRVLDEIGLNTLTIKKRRQEFLRKTPLVDMYKCLNENRIITAYNFGSQAEGATTPGLDSDLDLLHCLYDVNVIQNWSDWREDQTNLLMLHDKTTPGYCRLQMLRQDVPLAEVVLLDDTFAYDCDDRVILKNTVLNTPDPQKQEERNGPACSVPGGIYLRDKDIVRALHCESWPILADEFTTRYRPHGWPSQSLIQKAVSYGVFLVPVGYKLSPTEPLEWRISASLADRCFMLSLNSVHIKCFVVLKMVVKTFIEPRARKCVSSYHCKTALLYSVENTEPVFWREENLVPAVTRCLKMLLAWVTDIFCPQFIIPEENLFAGKVTDQKKHTLQSILKMLIQSEGRALLYVQIDALGHRLQRKLTSTPSVVPVLDSPETKFLIGEFAYASRFNIDLRRKRIILNDKYTKQALVIRSVYRNIVLCTNRNRHSESHERQANQEYIENLTRWLGSMLASFFLSREIRVPSMAIQLLCVGANYDVSSILKLASVFYNNGDFRQLETVLRVVVNHVKISPFMMQLVCSCYPGCPRAFKTYNENTYLLQRQKARAKLSALCVRFSPQEIHSAPPALRYEFFRSFGEDLQHKDYTKDEWMDLAVVDCIPYLYYLLYLTYRQLGKHDLKIQSLIELCIRLEVFDDLKHQETGWNLVGHCMELEHNPEDAIACYQMSLKIRPRNNAAKWHIAMLCYKSIFSR